MIVSYKLSKSVRIGLVAIAAVFLSISCDEKDNFLPPRVLTASVDEITSVSALVGGNVTSDGGTAILERGVFWGTTPDVEVSGTKLLIGADTDIFYETLTDLTPGTKYYVKAFASNSKGSTYGNETFFTTVISFPQVATASPVPVSVTSVTVGGNATSDGGFAVSERGVFWGTSPNTHSTGKKETIGEGLGEFSITLDNLAQGTTYYTRAYAKNIKGTALGEEVNFTTTMVEPTVKTLHSQDVTVTTAIINGEILSNGGTSITSKGFFWGTQSNAHTNGARVEVHSEGDAFQVKIEELLPGTIYYYTTFATNNVGTSYGEEFTFTTQGQAPEANTEGYENLKTSSVMLKGLVSANQLETIVRFEYGTTDSYGSSIVAEQSPINDYNVEVSALLSGLEHKTTYHFRVVAQNQLGTTYGKDTTFTTVLTGITGQVTDADGNSYTTIGIGYQYWTTSNLRTTQLNNNVAIALVESDSIWRKLTTPGMSWYGNDSSYAADSNLGALYNWYAVNSGMLCPTGWRVPSHDDVDKLMDYLGGSSIAGGLLKATGTSQWNSPNAEATNEYSFNALPAGKRDHEALFDFIGLEANWWTTTDYSTHTSAYFYILYNYGNAYQAYINKKSGLSVRCVKD